MRDRVPIGGLSAFSDLAECKFWALRGASAKYTEDRQFIYLLFLWRIVFVYPRGRFWSAQKLHIARECQIGGCSSFDATQRGILQPDDCPCGTVPPF